MKPRVSATRRSNVLLAGWAFWTSSCGSLASALSVTDKRSSDCVGIPECEALQHLDVAFTELAEGGATVVDASAGSVDTGSASFAGDAGVIFAGSRSTSGSVVGHSAYEPSAGDAYVDGADEVDGSRLSDPGSSAGSDSIELIEGDTFTLAT